MANNHLLADTVMCERIYTPSARVRGAMFSLSQNRISAESAQALLDVIEARDTQLGVIMFDNDLKPELVDRLRTSYIYRIQELMPTVTAQDFLSGFIWAKARTIFITAMSTFAQQCMREAYPDPPGGSEARATEAEAASHAQHQARIQTILDVDLPGAIGVEKTAIAVLKQRYSTAYNGEKNRTYKAESRVNHT